MWDEILSKFGDQFEASDMRRIKGLLYETPAERKRRHPLQLKSAYVLPGLSGKMVLNIEEYPQIAAARDRFQLMHPEIKGEILSYLQQFGRPEVHNQRGGSGGEKWRVVSLSRIGKEVPEVSKHFPKTMLYLGSCSKLIYPVAGISFSLLEPGAYIAPHCDRTNIFIHLHQSVVTPVGCGLRVGESEITFEETKSNLFDPSFQHEAWNRSAKNRVQLIVPVWHPEITSVEREVLRELFGSLRDLLPT